MVRLHVNIDHVATLRQARRGLEPDPIAWLTDALEVSYPEGGQLLSVRYEGTQDAEEMKKIIDAVINAYQQEVIVARTVRATMTSC